MDEGGIATGFELLLEASDLADTALEQPGRFGLRPLAVENRLHHLEDIPRPLTHRDTIPVLYLDHLAPPSA